MKMAQNRILPIMIFSLAAMLFSSSGWTQVSAVRTTSTVKSSPLNVDVSNVCRSIKSCPVPTKEENLYGVKGSMVTGECLNKGYITDPHYVCKPNKYDPPQAVCNQGDLLFSSKLVFETEDGELITLKIYPSDDKYVTLIKYPTYSLPEDPYSLPIAGTSPAPPVIGNLFNYAICAHIE